MTVNQVISKSVSDPDLRHIMFTIKKKCSEKVLDSEAFFKICDQSVYYVCKVLHSYPYRAYMAIKNDIFSYMLDLQILDCKEEGIRFKV